MRRLHPRRRLRIVGAIGFALGLLLSTTAGGQEPPSDPTSLARYIPKDNVVFYIEHRGLDSQPDAWKQTAANKILTETSTGAMLEEVARQYFEQTRAANARTNPRKWAEDNVTLIKHLARSGFALGAWAKPDEPNRVVWMLAIRDGYKEKAVRSILATELQGLNAPEIKPQSVVRNGHKVITGTRRNGSSFTWWVDDSRKQDLLIMGTKAEEADAVFDVLDGKRASVLDHPRRAELIRSDGRFLPTGLAFVSPGFTIAEAGEGGKKFEKDYGYLGLGNITSFDVRWGFQDDALMTISRVATSGPRKGVLSFLFDTSSFEKAKPPPIPSTLSGFTAASIDMAGALDRMRAQLKPLTPDADAMVDKLVANVKEKTKLRLKEDLLAHLGPKVAWYTLPGKPASKGPAGLAGMLGASMEVPKFALVCDVDDPSAFGKALDQAMAALNRELKAVGKPPAEAPAKGARSKAASGPSLEFRPLLGEGKGYVLNVPPELAGQVPPSLRPSIRVGPKQVVIAISPEVARLVLDSKANWTPPANLSVAYQDLPTNLKLLNVSDPRETLPDLLATFPAKVQQLAALAAAFRPPPGGAAPPQPPDARAPLVLQFDAAKLPSADAIKALLFPSLLSVEATGEELKIVSRDAFPSFVDPSSLAIQMSLVLPAIQAARAGRPPAPPGMAPPPGVPPAGTPPAPAPGRARPAANTSPL